MTRPQRILKQHTNVRSFGSLSDQDVISGMHFVKKSSLVRIFVAMMHNKIYENCSVFKIGMEFVHSWSPPICRPIGSHQYKHSVTTRWPRGTVQTTIISTDLINNTILDRSITHGNVLHSCCRTNVFVLVFSMTWTQKQLQQKHES